MRGKQAPKRNILPDPKYQNILLAKFINFVMRKGKKITAQKIVYGAFDLIKEKTKKDPLETFDEAIKNVSPQMETKSRRVGGANYQVPMPVRGERRNGLSFRWIIAASQARKGKPMHINLAEELMAAAQNQGEAVRKKQDMHRMAEANRAFAHFARF
ncbi:MAG TPA: 30S ribosomal protein S7 [Candidatus Magasanikbacteria bacterium]|uniref:Small ribosomal subunit protein uS7 n=2 Tax=Candidatus Magasanikiibacteriota TaxID=1752731 RepID=A0A0G0WKJ4_9BACT|nr:MAG: 30S ribosomal protein S7 [Candidatus Magasanikbacteria bacterium GW2011_GWC2_41_17]KKS13334.1 MAG: 30S ribosomal protein S7 [Candidatus Magasanikbacteria bacterium GW2011_GWA2_41_55]MBI5023039.1 30S ribosomal protein S7 [Candidatus Magasanikbacteria bacterium]HBV58005.1 30S ribosomal protein S7 [Candidatus Magasanikbacteria bacterium]HBX16311.1 30S ribosomal protein S7 [Candidatus Magasanikbacteria bacterium]